MAIWGLDVQEVRELGKKLQNEAGDIERTLSTLTSKLNSTTWKGPDAERFRNEWTGEHTASLKKVINALRDAGQKAEKNAAQQENISQ